MQKQVLFSQPSTWDLLDKKMLLMGVCQSVNSVEAEKDLRDTLLPIILDCGLAASRLFILPVICKGEISRLVNLRNTF